MTFLNEIKSWGLKENLFIYLFVHNIFIYVPILVFIK